MRGVVLGTLLLALGLGAPRSASACRPSTGDLLRERVGRGGTIASVRADRPSTPPSKANAGPRGYGEVPHRVPGPPPIAQPSPSSATKFEGQRNDGRRTRDALASLVAARRARAAAGRKSTATEHLLITAPSAVFYEANAPPARWFGVAGS